MSSEYFLRQFEQHEHLIGNLFLDQEEVGSCVADLFYNEFDSNHMHADLRHVQMKEPFHFLLHDMNSEVRFEDQHGRIDFVFRVSTMSLGAGQDFGARVYEVKKGYDWVPDGKMQLPDIRFSAGYCFPLTNTLKRGAGATRHDHRGFFFGYTLSNTEWLAPVMPEQWNDEIVEYKVRGYDAMLYPAVHFEEKGEKILGKETLVGVHYAKLTLSKDIARDQKPKAIEDAREISESVSRTLSLLDHDRVNWYRENIYSKDMNGCAENEDTIRWRSPQREGDFYHPGWSKSKDYRAYLPSLVNAIVALQGKRKKHFIEIHNSLQLAYAAPSYELSIVYFHSCIELLRKALGFKDKPLQQGILRGCDRVGIKLEDVFSVEELDGVRKSNRRFQFTAIRDSYLHNGLSMERFPDALNVRAAMRTLIERLLLTLLDLDYKQSPLGKTSIL